MKPIEGRLQSAEHILAKVLENKLHVAVAIAKFKEDSGTLEVNSVTELRGINLTEIQEEVNQVIKRGISVHKSLMKREEAEKEFDLIRVPPLVKELTIIDFVGFDRRPCRDSHVGNTKEIGQFTILNFERAGKDRFRFTFKVG